jgi:capsular exopolysaccharide synthesis family protein
MVSQDNRLLPLPSGDRAVDRPLEAPISRGYGYSGGAAEVNVRDYLMVIYKRKWLILTLVLIITSLATIQMYRLPSIYEAQSVIQIEPRRDSILKSGKEIVINTGNQKDPAYWQTQLKLLESPALARQVILSLNLQNNQQFFGSQSQAGVFTSLRRIIAPPKPAAGDQPEKESGIQVISSEDVTGDQLSSEMLAKLEPYEDAIKGGLTVEPVPQTNLVNIHFVHTDPALAQQIANTLADVFAYNNLDRSTQTTKEAQALLAQKLSELEMKIKKEEQDRLAFIISHDLPTSSDPGSDLTAAQLNQYSRDLLSAENDRKDAESRLQAAVNATDPTTVPEVAADKRIQSLRDKLDQLQQKYAELKEDYTDDWPAVKKVNAQIQGVKEALAQAPKEIVGSLKMKYEAAKSREEKLRASYQGKYNESTAQSVSGIQLSSLNSELETDKQYYQTLLAKQRELENTSGDARVNNVTVTQRARVPHGPIGPPRVRNVLIAFLLSFGVGIGLAFLLDYLDDTLKSVDDVDRYIHLPALALIPANKPERMKLRGKPLPHAEGENALALIDDVRSPIAEAYRHLRTSLLLSSAGQPPKTILVTSSQPSEGKTTTAVNTAVMLAQTGAEVVILDCDLRRPRLHAHFNASNVRGVTNFLSGESDLDSSLQSYDRLPNLKLMTSGPVPPNPAELLGSDEMRRLITLLGERFSHIIIDSPPAISFTDASILSTLVDGVMLVVHGGRSSRAVVRRAKQQLLDVGAHIFGVVLNNVKLESTDYYYYPGYYSSYYSNDGDDAHDGAAEAGTSGSH